MYGSVTYILMSAAVQANHLLISNYSDFNLHNDILWAEYFKRGIYIALTGIQSTHGNISAASTLTQAHYVRLFISTRSIKTKTIYNRPKTRQ